MTIDREDVETFANHIQNMVSKHFKENLKTLWDNGRTPLVKVSYGKRYAKIYKENDTQRHVHSFVDMQNGDVLKPATWSKPAKHARGNIYDEYAGMGSVNWTGANYL